MTSTQIVATKAEHDSGASIVSVKGMIVTNLADTEVASILAEILKSSSAPKVVLNLASVRYIDSFSFNWIIKLKKEIEGRGGRLTISDPNDDILNLFELTNFGKAVPVYAKEDDALDALTSGAQGKRIANA
jgi:anti-sigma B factor antagonist